MSALEFETAGRVRIQILQATPAYVSVTIAANGKRIFGEFNRDETRQIVEALKSAFPDQPQQMASVDFKSRKDIANNTHIKNGWTIEKTSSVAEGVKLISPLGEQLTITRNDLQAVIDKLFPPAVSERVDTVFDVNAIQTEGQKVIDTILKVNTALESFKHQFKK